jgi:hypothetical protein
MNQYRPDKPKSPKDGFLYRDAPSKPTDRREHRARWRSGAVRRAAAGQASLLG